MTPNLTPRQRQALTLAANGYTNREIGRLTGGYTPDNTAKHLAKAYRTLGARDRAHAVAIALATGILTPADIQPPGDPQP